MCQKFVCCLISLFYYIGEGKLCHLGFIVEIKKINLGLGVGEGVIW